MSDEAKRANLKERINQARNKERWMTIFFLIGFGGIFIGWDFGDITIMLVGVILLVFGFAEGWHLNSQKNKLIKQLREIGSDTTKER